MSSETQGYFAESQTGQPRAAHDALLLYAITDQLGPLAGRVVRVLVLYGALTLKEIADAVKAQYDESNVSAFVAMSEARAVRSAAIIPSQDNNSNMSEALLSDAAIKEVMTRLLLHRIVDVTYRKDITIAEEKATRSKEATLYSLHGRHALLGWVLFPLILCEVRRRYGGVAEALVTAFHQLGVLPARAAVQLAARRLTRIPHTHNNTNSTTSNTSLYDGRCEACKAIAQLEQSGTRLVRQLRQDRWLECVGTTTNSSNEITRNSEDVEGKQYGKRTRDTTTTTTGYDEEVAAGDYNMTSATLQDEAQAYRLNLRIASAKLFESAVGQLVLERYGDCGTRTSAEALAECIAGFVRLDLMTSTNSEQRHNRQGDNNKEGGMDDDDDELLPVYGGIFTTAQLQRAIALNHNTNTTTTNITDSSTMVSSDISLETITAALAQLCRPLTLYFPPPSSSSSALLSSNAREDGLSGRSGRGLVRHYASRDESREGYRMLYQHARRALQEGTCERVVFTRHGVVGVRVMKLLWRHHFLEDRTLAEQAITTHAKVREVLHAMMQDGYVMQQELPKTDNLNERLAKHSFFLWGCDVERHLLPAVREQLAQSLHHALVKLAEALVQRDNVTGLANNNNSNNGVYEKSIGSDTTSSAGVLQQTTTNTTSAAVEQGIVRTNEEWAHMFSAEAAQSAALNSTNSNSNSGNASRSEKVSEEVIQRVVRAQRNVCGLQSCALALMRMLFLVDCL